MRDGAPDRVDCGDGDDLVLADAVDVLLGTGDHGACEQVVVAHGASSRRLAAGV